MANLGNIGLFGTEDVNTLRESSAIVAEVMANKPDNKRLPKTVIRKRLDAFEVVSSQYGLDPQEQEYYSDLLKNC